MGNTVKERLSAMLKNSGHDEASAAKRANLPYNTVWRITSGETKTPSDNTLTALAKGLGYEPDWLITGKGSMKKMAEADWKGEAYRNLEDQVAFLKSIVYNLTGGKPVDANFLNYLSKIGGPDFLTVLRPTGS